MGSAGLTDGRTASSRCAPPAGVLAAVPVLDGEVVGWSVFGEQAGSRVTAAKTQQDSSIRFIGILRSGWGFTGINVAGGEMGLWAGDSQPGIAVQAGKVILTETDCIHYGNTLAFHANQPGFTQVMQHPR